MLETIYIVRHGFRSNWNLNPSTGVYSTSLPTPTGIPTDPALTSYGVSQSRELATFLSSISPKPDRIYSSPFYRCIQTINPLAETLNLPIHPENGIAEWFGYAPFDHPRPATPDILKKHYPRVKTDYSPVLVPPAEGETLLGIHERVAVALARLIKRIDEEGEKGPRTIVLCAHAAPNIAMGRVLTGESEKEVRVGTCSVSEYRRKAIGGVEEGQGEVEPGNMEKGKVAWVGSGVGGGWEMRRNGDCKFMKGGEERNWWFDGDESFVFVEEKEGDGCPIKEFSGAREEPGGPGTKPVETEKSKI